jgi:oligopeptide transport system substrate-binding protein
MTADDPCTYTIRLKNAFWSDGLPITAKDVHYSWLSLLDPNRVSPHATYLFLIKGAKEFHEGLASEKEVQLTPLNDTEIRIRLNTPCPFFDSLLASPGLALIPSHFDNTVASWNKPATIPVSGPYQIVEYAPKNKLLLKKNERYHRASEIEQETLEINFVDDTTSLSMLEMGDLDWIGSPLGTLGSDSINFLNKKGLLHFSKATGTAFLRINTTKPYLADKKLRQSLFHAINRNNIVRHILIDGYSEALSLLPPCLLSEKSFCLQNQTPTLWPKETTLHLAYSNVSERSKRIAQTLQQNLSEALGISVVLSPYDAQHFFKRISALDYDIALGSFFADYMNPYSFFSAFEDKNSGSNNTGWENPQYQELMKQLLTTKNASPIYTELLSLLHDEMPIIPLYYFSFLYATKGDRNNIGISPLGYFDFHEQIKVEECNTAPRGSSKL